MTPHEAHIYNAAIDAALREYSNGKGAILALKKRFSISVDHVGTQTKQDVEVVDDANDS